MITPPDGLQLPLDAEEMLTTYLAVRLGELLPARADGSPAVKVLTDLYLDWEDDVPLIQITRVGGGQVAPPTLDGPRLDVDCYDTEREDASTLARIVSALMRRERLTTVAMAGGQFTAVVEETGPSYRSSLNPKARCYGCTYVLTSKRTGRATP